MRSLLNIIKASQYGEMKSKDTLADDSVHPQTPASDEVKKRQIEEKHQAIVKDAFQKAKNIVEAAENYSQNQLRESTMRMNEECAQMKVRSYEDGYNLGLAEGKKEGNALGYQAGYEEGLKKAEEENRQAKEELARMLETVEAEKTKTLNEFSKKLEGLAIVIAQKIIKKELSIDSKAMQSIILNVMGAYRNQEWVRIHVSQDNAELLTKADCNIIKALQGISDNIKIIPSPELNDGDCKIDMPDRLIDAGTDTQLEYIKTELQL